MDQWLKPSKLERDNSARHRLAGWWPERIFSSIKERSQVCACPCQASYVVLARTKAGSLHSGITTVCLVGHNDEDDAKRRGPCVSSLRGVMHWRREVEIMASEVSCRCRGLLGRVWQRENVRMVDLGRGSPPFRIPPHMLYSRSITLPHTPDQCSALGDVSRMLELGGARGTSLPDFGVRQTCAENRKPT